VGVAIGDVAGRAVAEPVSRDIRIEIEAEAVLQA
jgi:hypothetical protein